MSRHVLLTVAVAVAALGLSLLGGVHRRAAFVGSTASSFTAMASILAIGRMAGSAQKPVQRALLVMTVMFLVRILLVGLGTALVARAGENVFAFVIAFFVPYFIFSAIEGSYIHSLGRRMGPTA